jgi:hypothetical protein
VWHLSRFGVGGPVLLTWHEACPASSSPEGSKRSLCSQRAPLYARRVLVSMHRSRCAIERPRSTGKRFPRRFVFIVGSGHSGSTVLAMILGAHPEILAPSEIAFFDRWIQLNDLCNCGVPVRSCPLWSKVVDRLSAKRAFSPTDPRLRPSLGLGELARLMKVPSAQSQPLRQRVSDAKYIASDDPGIKRGPEVADLSRLLWGFKEGKTSFICVRRVYYVSRCRSQSHCARYAKVQIECVDRIGQSFWKRDYCEDDARSVLKRAEKRGILVFRF